MFDPHRTRRSDSRYFTRKGQVLQASRVNVNPIIDQRLVPYYRDYINKNITTAPPPPSFGITGVSYGDNIIKFSDMEKNTEPTKTYTYRPQYSSVAIIFYIDTFGNSYVKYIFVTGGSTVTETIENISESYSYMDRTINLHPVVDSQTKLNDVEKGIVNASGNGKIINFYGGILAISNTIPLVVL